MNNITFLLGAGASCQVLPVVKDIEQKLDWAINEFQIEGNSTVGVDFYFNSINKTINKKPSKLLTELQQEFIEDLKWLKSECANHFSIDTFAKKLYLQRDVKRLNLLKFMLSAFFTFLQNEKVDDRYDSFFAAIIDDLDLLPNNIKILSWNYDYQLEAAFDNFYQMGSLSEQKKKLKVISKGDSDFKMSRLFNEDSFGVYKINGAIGLKDDGNPLVDSIKKDGKKLFERILNRYYWIKYSEKKSSLSFAWEKDENTESFFSKLIASIMKTDTLVVIGYSFPFFNRKTDSMILDNMRGLKKIYVQDPNNGDAIKSRIESILPKYDPDVVYPPPVEIEVISKIKDQFYLPFEL